MGKLTDLAAVSTAKTKSFVYLPPPEAFEAVRILVKPNLGYPVGPPVTVSAYVLDKVLRGLRRANPHARIVVIEGVCSDVAVEDIFEQHGVYDLLDENMRAGDAEQLIMTEYPNLLDAPVKYAAMTAPGYIGEYDCVISVGAFKRTTLKGEPLISASLKNLYGLFPREKYRGRSPKARGQLHSPSVPDVLKDIYFSVGYHFHGAVVDLTHKFVSKDWRPDVGEAVPVGQVVWGTDLLAVDEVACRLGGEATADYIAPIRALRDELRRQGKMA
jgi:uncharacterized protein (DUF362 family)